MPCGSYAFKYCYYYYRNAFGDYSGKNETDALLKATLLFGLFCFIGYWGGWGIYVNTYCYYDTCFGIVPGRYYKELRVMTGLPLMILLNCAPTCYYCWILREIGEGGGYGCIPRTPEEGLCLGIIICCCGWMDEGITSIFFVANAADDGEDMILLPINV